MWRAGQQLEKEGSNRAPVMLGMFSQLGEFYVITHIIALSLSLKCQCNVVP
jgi:hypothetical protein